MSKSYIPTELRKFIFDRAFGLCEYCLLPALFAGTKFCIDHIIPETEGGLTSKENLALSCPNCNSFKHIKIQAIDPISNTIVPLFNPRTDSWKSHFAFNENQTIITGISPIGRVTVRSLRMNEIEMQNLRGIMVQAGVFPPEVFFKN